MKLAGRILSCVSRHGAAPQTEPDQFGAAGDTLPRVDPRLLVLLAHPRIHDAASALLINWEARGAPAHSRKFSAKPPKIGDATTSYLPIYVINFLKQIFVYRLPKPSFPPRIFSQRRHFPIAQLYKSLGKARGFAIELFHLQKPAMSLWKEASSSSRASLGGLGYNHHNAPSPELMRHIGSPIVRKFGSRPTNPADRLGCRSGFRP